MDLLATGSPDEQEHILEQEVREGLEHDESHGEQEASADVAVPLSVEISVLASEDARTNLELVLLNEVHSYHDGQHQNVDSEANDDGGASQLVLSSLLVEADALDHGLDDHVEESIKD